MDYVDWSRVLFDEHEDKLALISQGLRTVPSAVINLYSDRVRHLDLSSNYISELNWIYLFPNLITVILDNNQLQEDVFIELNSKSRSPLEHVKTLSLNNNKLSSLSFISKNLVNYFPRLQHLSLLGNPVCPDGLSLEKSNFLSYESYRELLSNSFQELKFLDFKRIHRQFNVELPEKTTKILKFSPKIIFAKLNFFTPTEYSPLPENIRPPGDHRGSYGISVYKYIGNHSEGNRFIRNKDL